MSSQQSKSVLELATMTSMARALYGPRNDEYMLILRDNESIMFLGLLQNEIERYEQNESSRI